MGSRIARELLERSPATVVVADRRLEAARRLASGLGGRAEAVFVDADREATLAGADAAVGALGPFYRFALPCLRAALEARVAYVDICDDWEPLEAMRGLDPAARAAGVTAITGLGWTPGLTNLLALKAARALERVEEVRIAWAGGAADSEGLAVVAHLLNAVRGEVPTFRDGRRVGVAALSGEERVEFPPPLGPVRVFHCGHPEPLTLPAALGARAVSLKGGLTPDWNNRVLGLFARLGLLRTRERRETLARWVHRVEGAFRVGGLPWSGARVEVSGVAGGSRQVLTYVVVDRMARLTSVPAATGALMLARGEVRSPGVHAPEEVLDPDAVLQEAQGRGLRVLVGPSSPEDGPS